MTITTTSKVRDQQMAERRQQMPGRYRAAYDRAVSSKSRKAAVYSFCGQKIRKKVLDIMIINK